MLRRSCWLGLALLTSATSLAAQQGTCDIHTVPGRPAPNVNILGSSTYISGRARFTCDNGINFQSDSAVAAFGVRILIGGVIFEDPDRTVRAARLEYTERSGLVQASGNTNIVEKKSGNTLHAPTGVTYNRVTRTNPEARMLVPTGRPTMTLYGESQGKKDTTVVVGNSMDVIGERFFRSSGNVTIKRGTLDARGEEALMLAGGDTISLWRGAHIKGEDYTLDADSIYGETEADEFRELRAFRQAKLDSQDMDVTSARLRIMLDSGVVNRLIAVGAEGTAQPEPARVLATDFNLIADSIDALMPEQKLEKVIAVGRALGQRAADSLDLKLPAMIRQDWLRGDTVIATFVEAPDSIKQRRAANDSSFDRVMDKLIAVGTAKPATALYRMRSEQEPAAAPQVSYITAKRITATFKDGAVHDVDAEQEIKGLYLQPKADPRKPPTTPPVRGGQR